MQVELREEFKILEDGVSYALPMYDVVDGQGIVEVKDTGEENDPFQSQIISFVRGSKLGTEDVPKRRGTLHDHLLAVMIHDLKLKHNLVPSKETAMTITKLEEALHWSRQRSVDRAKREVQGTYQK